MRIKNHINPEKIESTRIPLIWYLFFFAGIIYSLIGLLSLIFIHQEREITHLPAWLRRIMDGSFIIIISLIALINKNKRPWKGWFETPLLLYYSLLSLIVHYGGMLPPFYLYDNLPFFNRVMHFNATFILIILSFKGREANLPQLIDVINVSFIAVLWEFLEYLTTPPSIDYWTVINIGYGWWDTKLDLLFDLFGIIFALLVFRIKLFYENRQN